MKVLNSTIIIVVVIFASLGYIITSLVIKSSLIQYSSLPPKINFKVYDERTETDVTFNLNVINKQTKDSLLVESNPSESTIVLKNILFHRNPIFLVWIMLVSIMISIAAGSFPVFVIQIFRLKNIFKLSTIQLLTGFIYAIIVVLSLAINSCSELRGYYKPPDIINDFNILLNRGEILNRIVICTTILSVPTFLVIFLTAISSDNLLINSTKNSVNREDEIQKLSDEELVKQKKMKLEAIARQFEFLSQSLKGAMQILAIIVVFSVLTSSALRMSIKSVVEIDYFDIFPIEASYVYGMYFSLFLFIMYIPSYIYLKNRFMQFKDYINMQQFDEQWSQSVLGIVKFDGTALDNLKLAITILAPLITSFLPDSLQFIK